MDQFDRIREYKQGINRDAVQRKRTEITLNNRKERKKIKLNQKRKQFDLEHQEKERKEHINWSGDTLSRINELKYDHDKQFSLYDMIQLISSDGINTITTGLVHFRRTLRNGSYFIASYFRFYFY